MFKVERHPKLESGRQLSQPDMRLGRQEASKTPWASSLANTQTRNSSALILPFLPNIRISKSGFKKNFIIPQNPLNLIIIIIIKIKIKGNPFSSIAYHNEFNSLRRDEQATNNVILFTLTTRNNL